MATAALNESGSTHEFYWSGPAPGVGTVLVTDRGAGYLVRGTRPSKVLQAVVLQVLRVDPVHPCLADRPRARLVWQGLHGHPKELGRIVTDVADVGRGVGVGARRFLRRRGRRRATGPLVHGRRLRRDGS